MKRQVIATAILSALLLTFAMPAYAEDDFNEAVHRIGDRLGQHPLRIPFLGVMLFFTPARGTHIRFATFEDVHTQLSLADLEHSMNGALGSEWHPFVKVDSRKSHESTLIYARAVNGDMRLMVITAESNEVTVVQVDLSKKMQERWMSDARHESHHHVQNDDGDGA
jgi:hypothetical protein